MYLLQALQTKGTSMAVLPSPEDDPLHPSRGRPHDLCGLFYEVIADRRRTVNFILVVMVVAIACGIVVFAAFYGAGAAAANLHGVKGRIPGTVAGGAGGTFLAYVLKNAGTRLFKRLMRDDGAADGRPTKPYAAT
jgi:hypothetical protein